MFALKLETTTVWQFENLKIDSHSADPRVRLFDRQTENGRSAFAYKSESNRSNGELNAHLKEISTLFLGCA